MRNLIGMFVPLESPVAAWSLISLGSAMLVKIAQEEHRLSEEEVEKFRSSLKAMTQVMIDEGRRITKEETQ